ARTWPISVAIDAERDDGQLRQAWAHRTAEPRLEIGDVCLDDGIDRVAHRLARADDGVPGLNRRDQPIGNGLHDGARDDRVRDPDGAVAVLVVAAAAPRQFIDAPPSDRTGSLALRDAAARQMGSR